MLAPPKPPPDELELLIKEARARRRRRHLLIAVGVAIATALGVSIYALVGANGSPSATGGTARAGAPSCRASQLTTSAESGPGQSALADGASIQLVDTSTHACAVPAGLPNVTFTLRGRTTRVAERAMGPPYTGLGTPAGHVLAPGRKVFYMLEWNYCSRQAPGPTHGTATAIVRFENGLRFAMPVGTPENIPILPSCQVAGGPPETVLVTPLLRVSS